LAHPFSIYPALEVERVVVGDRAQVYRVPLRDGSPAAELQVAALPHFSRHQVLAKLGEGVTEPDKLIEEQIAHTVRGLGAAVDPQAPAVFVGHCHVNQADLGPAHALFGVSDVEVSLSTLTSGQPFPYFALGHIHKRQVLSNEPFVAYPGSLERIDFGEGERIDVGADKITARSEAEPKGFYRFDLAADEGWQLAGEPRFHTIDARRFITLRLGELATSDPLDDVSGRIAVARADGITFDDAFVRITASLAAPDRARVSLASVRAVIAEAYDVRLAVDAPSSTLVRDPRFAERMSENEALASFLQTRDDWAEDREALQQLGRELTAEVTAR
jgi:exonuclease SbcD